MQEKWIDYSLHAVGIGLLAIVLLIAYFVRRAVLQRPVDWEDLMQLELFADSMNAVSPSRGEGKRSAGKVLRQEYKKVGKKAPAKSAPPVLRTDTLSDDKNYSFQIELNMADSADLLLLRGIGPYFAHRILSYRERLGGFVKAEQLLEIPGMDAERFARFSQNIRVDSLLAAPFDLARASPEQLSAHPYIGRFTARSIVLWREINGPETCTLEILRRQGIIRPGTYAKLLPYCTIK